MLDAFKRLIGGRGAGPGWNAVSQWALDHQLKFKREHEGEGFVIEGAADKRPWRLEWGPPQRLYITGRELRLRIELGLSPNLQLLLLSQPLLEQLESQMYERFTESTQTMIDGATPEEMRWLAMFPKVNYKADKAVRMRFGLIGAPTDAAAAWVEGPLVSRLEEAGNGLLKKEPAFLMMVLRGRLYLRMQMPEPDVGSIGQAISLFETAAQQAMKLVAPEDGDGSGWSSSGASAWQNQIDDDPAKRGGG
jgi:hypothetical protein